jgi:hypothetical protein
MSEEQPPRIIRFEKFKLTLRSLGFGFAVATVLFGGVLLINGKPDKVDLERLQELQREHAEELAKQEEEEEKSSGNK